MAMCALWDGAVRGLAGSAVDIRCVCVEMDEKSIRHRFINQKKRVD